jgi:hypothetical protein
MPVEQLEEIKKVKGDISTGLWIRRAVQKTLSEGRAATNRDPPAAPTAVVVVTPPTTTHPLEEETRKKEVEV